MSSSTLKFLADESCDFSVIRVLRTEGYDVEAVCEVSKRSTDQEIIKQAYREQRILITEDKDFGWLVFATNAESAGVILIRYPGNARSQLAQNVKTLIRERGNQLFNTFVVMQPGHVRISRRPND